jgi:hypothetical protein
LTETGENKEVIKAVRAALGVDDALPILCDGHPCVNVPQTHARAAVLLTHMCTRAVDARTRAPPTHAHAASALALVRHCRRA